MKKRILSCLMALALCLTLLPTAALAEETEGTAQTPPAVEKAADPANGEAKQESQSAEAKQESQSAETKRENQPAEAKQESQSAEAKQENQPAEAKQENQPAEAKQENESAEQEEQQEDSAAKQAVAEVQAMIDALPDAAELDGMDDDNAMAVYEAFQTACEAYYDTLSEKQQAQLKNTEKLAALSERFSQLETLAAGEHQDHGVCGKSDCTESGHSNIDFNMWLASSSSGKYALNVGEEDKLYGTMQSPSGDKYVLTGGNYYLKTGVDGYNSDVTIEHPILIKGDVTICLNGQTIQSTATDKPVFEVVSGGKLTLTDCKSNTGTGKVTHFSGVNGGGVEVNGGEFNLYGGSITKNTAAKGGGVKVDGGTFNLYNGGSITNNKAEGKNSTGGGVYVVGGTFTMSGGTISGNTANSTNGADGADGGVGVYSGATFIMNGGEITGNEARSYSGGVGVHSGGTFKMSGGTIGGTTDGEANNAKYGGGVNVSNYGKFTMSGGEISGNKATENGGGVYMDGTTFTVSGAAVIKNNRKGTAANNVYLLGNKYITIDGTLDNGARIGVTTKSEPAAGGTIPIATATTGTGLTPADAAKFQSDLDGYAVSAKSDGTGLVLVKAHTHCICGKSSCNEDGHGAAVTFATVLTQALLEQNSYTLSGGTYYLNGTLSPVNKIEITGTVTICLNGQTIQSTAADQSVFEIADGGTLTLTDCKSNMGKVRHLNVSGIGVEVKKGTFDMYGGEITGNSASNGGGVYVWGGSKFDLYGGKISGNKVNNDGGGVYVGGSGSTFIMNGNASITDNTAKNGGGVGVYSGATFEMNGNASITDNTATSNGGVYEGGGKFNMSGGASISRNEATTGNGGGVYVGGGVFTMSGGSITSNHTANKANYGGGVYVDTHGTFNMSGGTIGGAAADKANKAKNGGGVYVSGGTFNMSGGSITGNDSNGVFVDDRATFTVSGAATVKGNTREGAASNVFLAGSKTITIGGKLTGSPNSIGVTRGAYLDIANNVNEDYSGIFFSDKTQYVVKYKDSQLVLAKKDTTAETHTHCLCGKTHTAIGDHKTEQEVTFATELKRVNGQLMIGSQPWITTSITINSSTLNCYVLPKGSYYLGSDLALDASIYISGNVQLCLNGNSIISNGDNVGRDVVIVDTNSSDAFTLANCRNGGSITHATGKNGCGVYMNGNGTKFNMYGGIITGNNSGGVTVTQTNTFNMYGGKITGNSAGFGGGVYNGGTVNMYGGEISDNTASNKGGGVYMVASVGNYQGGILKVSGSAKITDNTVKGVANNVYLPSGKTITIGTGGLSGTIGVTTEPKPAAGTPVTVIADTTGISGLTTHVVSDDNAYATAVEGSTIVLKVVGDTTGGETHTHTYDGTWKYDGTNHWQECTDANCPDRDGSVRGDTAHVYDNDTDTICNVCGYVRTGTTETVPVSGVALNKTSTSISVGNSEKLIATVTPVNATDKTLNWASSDTSVATVAPDGTVTAVKAGAATITATAADGSGKSAACTVTVTGSSTGGNTGGSSSGGGGGSSSGGSDSNPIIKTETKNNTDGSTTKTETRRDGSVTQTTTGKDGSVSKTETKPNGSSVTENKAADGSTGTVKTDKNGQTTAETKVSAKAVEDAKKNGEAVKAPVEVEASRNSGTAPTVKVELPKGAGETKVEIPVSNVKPGTVAVLVHPDGTEEIVKNSIPTEDGIQLTVDGNATVKIVDNSKGFIDTQDHWAEDAIDFVSARGLVNGMSATIYAPNNSTTRAQLWTILARQNDADLTGGSIWYEKAQNWAKDKGVSDGANPNAAINRAQMVTMLWRAKGQPAAGGTAHFTDVPADAYYAGAVSWAVENGITTGVGNGRFDPTGACTRAQIAAFLTRLYAEK